MKAKELNNKVNNMNATNVVNASNPNAGTIRITDIKVSAGVKSVTKKAKNLSESLKGILIQYRESITPVPAVKGDEKIAAYNKRVREHRAQLGADATALLLNTRVAVKYVAMALPKVDGVFVNEVTVYSESIDKDGKVKVTDTRKEAVALGVPILANNGKQGLTNPIEEKIVGKDGLIKYKGYKPVKKYTIDYVYRFIDYAVDLWIEDNRPAK